MADVHRLTERTLEGVFSRTPYLFARLDRFPTATFPRGLVEYLDYRFPRLVTYAIASRSELSPLRLTEIFQTATGPLRAGVKDGYYLFEGGLVVGHHLADVRTHTTAFVDPYEDSSLRERIFASPAGSIRLSPGEIEVISRLASYFEPIIVRKQRAAGFDDEGRSAYSSGYVYEAPPSAEDIPPKGASTSGSHASGAHASGASGASGSTGGGAPPRAQAPSAEDPYVMLGITASATDDEVKSAYRNQIKLNHPDKVAHLSPALQAFAQAQTIAVKNAYEAILAMRNRRR